MGGGLFSQAAGLRKANLDSSRTERMGVFAAGKIPIEYIEQAHLRRRRGGLQDVGSRVCSIAVWLDQLSDYKTRSRLAVVDLEGRDHNS
jgi:hypothetical protein